MAVQWADLFDHHGRKRVTKTDKAKRAFVLTKGQLKVLAAAGRKLAEGQDAPEDTVTVLFDPAVTVVKASFYASMRATDPDRPPEPRMGLEAISSWMRQADDIVLGSVGDRLFLVREVDAQLATAEEVARLVNELRPNAKKQRTMIARSPEMYLAGYCLARCGSPSPQGGSSLPPSWLGAASWDEAYDLFFEALGEGRTQESFRNSLKNVRDSFDRFLLSGRKGWAPSSRANQQQGDNRQVLALLAEWEDRRDEELRRSVEQILGRAPFASSADDTIAGVDGVAEAPSADTPVAPPMMLTEPQRIWVTGMWGFNPEIHGYVGFSNPGARDRYINECHPGDLMMVIGQNGETADPRDVGRLLGLVELDPRAVEERVCMSPEAYIEKVRRFGPDRWRHAMPVLRAWKINREVIASQVANTTCAASNARALGASCKLLTDVEVARVLALPVRAWKVWGRPEWAADAEDQPEVRAGVAVSKGPRPSFGPVSYDREDGENFLYLMQLMGNLSALFSKRSLQGKAVVKIGRSNDVKRRCEEMNCGFPPGLDIHWKVESSQRFETADDAHDAEQRLLAALEKRGLTIGKEFAIVPEREIMTLTSTVADRSAFVIRV